MLQLKRFEYNLDTFARYKVNSRYEFPTTLDIESMTENISTNDNNSSINDEEANQSLNRSLSQNLSQSISQDLIQSSNDNSSETVYDINGIVFHSGTAQTGHYFSCIKLCDKWFKFNDTDVTEESEESVLNQAYGGSSPDSYSYYNRNGTNANASILFYTLCGVNFEFSPETLIPQSMRAEIEKSNDVITHRKVLFSESLFLFVVNSRNAGLILSYFFRMFSHGDHKDENMSQNVKSLQFTDAMSDIITNEEQHERALLYFMNNFHEFFSVVENCPVN